MNDETEERLGRIEAAITTLAFWLAQGADHPLRAEEAVRISAILRGDVEITKEMRP